jgi:predicted flap endonuclease-1-like 5' DNA nuclease
MHTAQMKNAPNLWGWAIGAGAGAVAFGALVVVGEFDLFPAAALGGGVAGLVGLFLGMPWGASAPRPAFAAAAPAPMTHAAPAAPAAAPAAAVAPAAGPLRLTAARGGKADNLQEIEGIGPAMEKLVNALGFYHFDQIATWSDADIAVVDAEMKSFKGRIARDRWVPQAKLIVAEGLEAFRIRKKTNNY